MQHLAVVGVLKPQTGLPGRGRALDLPSLVTFENSRIDTATPQVGCYMHI